MSETPPESPAQQSILTSIKKSLGLAEDYTVYDLDLVLHINSVLSDLHQLGVGPDAGFEIVDDSATWIDFLGDDPRLNNVRSYTYLAVKMLFDPPTVGYVLTAWEKMLEKAEFRVLIASDEIKNPLPEPEVVVEEDLFGDPVIVNP